MKKTYVLQERERGYFNEIWTDITYSDDYKFICNLGKCYHDKYPQNRYRICEVYLYV